MITGKTTLPRNRVKGENEQPSQFRGEADSGRAPAVPRHDIFTREKRSSIMSRIRSKGTLIEMLMAKSFDELGIEYVSHPQVFGKPDFLVEGSIAVFCDGDFWHGYRMRDNPRLNVTDNREFWVNKIRRNIARDRKVVRVLRARGLKVKRFWEHDIRRDPTRCALAVRRAAEKTPRGTARTSPEGAF